MWIDPRVAYDRLVRPNDLGARWESRLRHRVFVTKPDRETVPEIDQADQGREIDQLLVSEVAANLIVDRVGRVCFRDAGEGFRPCQRRPLALGVECRFVPSVEQVEPLLGLAGAAGVRAAHM